MILRFMGRGEQGGWYLPDPGVYVGGRQGDAGWRWRTVADMMNALREYFV